MGGGGRPSGDAYVLHPQVQVWTLKAGYASSTSSWTPSVYLACPRAQTRGEKATSATEPRDYKGGPRPPLSCLGSWSAPRLRRRLLPPHPTSSLHLSHPGDLRQPSPSSPASPGSVPPTPPHRPPPASGPRRTEARRGRPGRAAPGAISTRERVPLDPLPPPFLPYRRAPTHTPPPQLPPPSPALSPTLPTGWRRPRSARAGKGGKATPAAHRPQDGGSRAAGRAGRAGGRAGERRGERGVGGQPAPEAGRRRHSLLPRRRRPGAPRPSPASALGTRAAQPTPFYFRDPVRR